MSIKKLIFLSGVISVFVFNYASAATLFLTSSVKQMSIGDSATVNIRINSDKTVNAAQGTLYYPRDIFDVDSVSKNNSIFDIWLTAPGVNSSTGEISFLGGSTNSFSGGSMEVFTVVFKARGNGSGTIGFKNSEVTAGDGTGANLLASTTVLTINVGAGNPGVSASGTVPIQQPVSQPVEPPKQIKRPPVKAASLPVKPAINILQYPNPEGWYNTISPFLAQWDLPADISEVATAVDKNPQTDPSKSEGLFDNKTFGELSDGIWYLHVRFKNNVGWGATAHYRIAINTAPPVFQKSSVKEGLQTSVTTPTLEYLATSPISGINNYSISIDGGTAAQTTSTSFFVSALPFGDHNASIRVFDNAGNSVESKLRFSIVPPPYITIGSFSIGQNDILVSLIFIFMFVLVGGIGIYKNHRSKVALRVAFSEEEMNKVFKLIEKDAEDLEKVVNPEDGTESKFMLDKLKGSISKMQEYLRKGLEKIKR